ncbi:uncharacterized protein [Rutidosis leptorrhynchoides]|uniref:uncharacterized protein n=1 Tax=Rutidosis leptorrhynchoides TaxID=125765 RepID=UPI003A9A0C89
MSINIGGGVNFDFKQRWIRNLCNEHAITILGIQETKLTSPNHAAFKALWGNFHFRFASSSASGRSGGILTMWDPSVFSCSNIISLSNVLIVAGTLANCSSPCFLINVYAPQSRIRKRCLWDYITSFVSSNAGHFIVFGDFNTVRNPQERFGAHFSNTEAVDFNNFIASSNLLDIPMGGREFTRFNKSFTQRAKLDRFLVSEELLDVFPSLTGLILSNIWSDHCPIILKNNPIDYGPILFKLFNSWFDIEGFDDIIPGILSNGVWVTQPSSVKEIFYDFFVNKFKSSDCIAITSPSRYIRKLSTTQAGTLIEAFSPEEIKKAIWSCSSDKSPGPDGFSFKFCKHFWSLISNDVIDMVRNFQDLCVIQRGCNSSFFSLIPKKDSPVSIQDYRPISLIGVQYKIIAKLLATRLSSVIGSVISPEQSAFIKERQILDGPLIVNEVVDWCKRKKKKAMLFKVDFDKAFDSIHWSYIFSMMRFMGFDMKWILWIKACLKSSKASLLLNGSPSSEFSIERGLRQGDPLSPFLFIIGMEGLHAAINDASDASLYSGLRINNRINNIRLNLCCYADDVLFIGEWDVYNAYNLVTILGCFFAVSGLKINLHKSSVFSVGVDSNEVNRLARVLGCSSANFPFTFLGISVGQNMHRFEGWKGVIDKVKNRLASWKANLLSFGGRLTLVKSVMGSIATFTMSLFEAPKKVIQRIESLRSSFFWGAKDNERKIHWVNWRLIQNPYDKGGLSVNCLKSLNLALLYKWRWRFFSNKDALWVKVISAIHGLHKGNSMPCMPNASGSWSAIHSVVSKLHHDNVLPQESLSIKVGNGLHTDFWHDPWIGHDSLAIRFPRSFALDTVKFGSVASHFSDSGWSWLWRREHRSGAEQLQHAQLLFLLDSVSFSGEPDRWWWDKSNDGVFYTHSARKIIDSSYHASFSFKTVWCNYVSIKVNIFIWRLKLHRLATLRNLEAKGLTFDNSCCGLCDVSEESHSHLFVRCDTSY